MKKYIPYMLLTAAIMLPLLLPGYILTIDLVFTPELHMPATIANDYLWHLTLFLLNQVLPSQIIEKCILLSIPLLAGIGMHRLLEYLLLRDMKALSLDAWHWGIYVGSIFYVANPFTYSRFMAGQYAVLLGYALLPFFVLALLKFLDKPARRTLAFTIIPAILISIVSIHTIGMMAILALVITGTAVWQHRKHTQVLKRYVRLALVGLGICLAASSYWLIPLAVGEGSTAQMIQQFDNSHSEAFATAGSNVATQFFNILKLQGFWLEHRDQYLLPQDHLPGWGTIRLLLWLLIAGGFIICWRYARIVAYIVAIVGLISIILAIGFPESILTSLGYREPQKFTALVALVFAICIAFGSTRLLHRMRQRSEWRYTLTASVLLLLIVIFTPTMYWGFAHQLTPRDYPAEWYALNRHLAQQKGEFRTLFLPWHQYMSFDFTDRIIANPAEQFFGSRTITSHDPELGSIRPAHDALRGNLERLLKDEKQQTSPSFGAELARHNIRYVIVAKEFDYRKYDYLANQESLTVAWEAPGLTMYRNTAYKEDR